MDQRMNGVLDRAFEVDRCAKLMFGRRFTLSITSSLPLKPVSWWSDTKSME
jgi:hypothetical protein